MTYKEQYALMQKLAEENPQVMEKVARNLLRYYADTMTGRDINELEDRIRKIRPYMVGAKVDPNHTAQEAIETQKRLYEALNVAKAQRKAAIGGTVGVGVGVAGAAAYDHRKKQQAPSPIEQVAYSTMTDLEKVAFIGALKAGLSGAKSLGKSYAKNVAEQGIVQASKNATKAAYKTTAPKVTDFGKKTMQYGDDLFGTSKRRLGKQIAQREQFTQMGTPMNFETGSAIHKNTFKKQTRGMQDELGTLKARTTNARVKTGIGAAGVGVGNYFTDKSYNEGQNRKQNYPNTYNY